MRQNLIPIICCGGLVLDLDFLCVKKGITVEGKIFPVIYTVVGIHKVPVRCFDTSYVSLADVHSKQGS